jgi:hypothetical protein
VTFVATTKEDYDKYMRILEVTVQTCATMLAVVFAYTLASQNMALSLRVWVTVTVFFLTVTIFFSGTGMILANKNEPKALKGLALISFIMLIGVILAMLGLLLLAIWR